MAVVALVSVLVTLLLVVAGVLASCGGTTPLTAPVVTAPPATTTPPPGTPVWVTKATGIIDPALAGYLTKTMKQAADAKAAALVIEIDTPGGLDTAMRQIIQGELDSPIPVVVYVYPNGARAASAGVYILMGADVAAMAPQTNLGAATPVALSGSMDDTMKAKVTNDAAAYIVALAKNHGRNATWAEQAVRQSVSLPADQALSMNVVDFVEPDVQSLCTAMDGFVTQPKGLVLHSAGAPIKEVEMGLGSRFLHAIANPDIAYILLIVGILGIIFEIAAPGHIVSGVVGIICLMLAFYGLAVLPVNFVGIVLIVVGMIMLIAEIKVQSHGALAIGGVIALVIGGLLLFSGSPSYLQVGWPVLVTVGVVALALVLLVVGKVRQAMLRPHATGPSALVGEQGITLTPLDPNGQVRLRGEIWKAKTEGETLLRDERIEVLNVEGLTLVVRRATGLRTEPQTEPAPEQ
jgi:membrane-bound serine protease (ClpP class)